ncbi:MAG: hypothetical protein KZQ93_05855 [Candidatus Thiodiazotropha sp. (ex Monitilora ramsayi)]|nr:hypothetical protein [Candidatus Thiodiazotropha sp. (ex Monitilora ramsayi)]
MATISIRRDRLKATAKVLLEGYPGKPTWTSRYSGTAWKPGDFHGSAVHVRANYPDTFLESYGYTGSAWVLLNQDGASLNLETAYDVNCSDVFGPMGCIPGVEIRGSSASFLDTVFSADAPVQVGVSGPSISPTYGTARFILYDWTTGATVANNEFGDYDLAAGHVYRLRWRAKWRGYGDPMPPPLIQIIFRDSTIAIPGAPESTG